MSDEYEDDIADRLLAADVQAQQHAVQQKPPSNDVLIVQGVQAMVESFARAQTAQLEAEQREETARARIAAEEQARRHAAELPLRQQQQEHHYRVVRNAQLIGAVIGAGLVGLVFVGKGDVVKDLLQGLALFAGGAGVLQLYLGRKSKKSDEE